MAKGYEQQQYEKQLSEAASLLAGEVPAGKERDYLIELSRRFQPEPEYPDGTIAIIRFGGEGPQVIARMDDGRWDDNLTLSTPNERDEVEPLRVLDDDEIAVPVVTKVTGQLRDDANQLDSSNGYGNPSSAVLRAYVEAIQAAEAANQQSEGHR